MYKLWGEHNIEAIPEDMSGFMVCGIQKLQSMKENQPDKFQKLVNATRLVVYDDERVIIRTKLEKPSKIKGLALI